MREEAGIITPPGIGSSEMEDVIKPPILEAMIPAKESSTTRAWFSLTFRASAAFINTSGSGFPLVMAFPSTTASKNLEMPSLSMMARAFLLEEPRAILIPLSLRNVRISMALFDVWHRFLPRLTKVSLEELRPCIKRYGLSQLLQAVRAQYFTWPRDRNVRMELIKYVRTKRPLFNKYYDARSAFVRLYLIGIFNMPMFFFDGVMVFLGFVCSFMKGKERIVR